MEPSEELIEFAHRMFDLARDGDAQLLGYVAAGLSPNVVDPQGNTFLMLAAYHGHSDLVAGLIKAGGDVEATNDRGQTPLTGAVFKSYVEVSKVLLDAGADPDAGTPTARATAQMFESEVLPLLPLKQEKR